MEPAPKLPKASGNCRRNWPLYRRLCEPQRTKSGRADRGDGRASDALAHPAAAFPPLLVLGAIVSGRFDVLLSEGRRGSVSMRPSSVLLRCSSSIRVRNFKHPSTFLWASSRAHWYGSGMSPQQSSCARDAMGRASRARGGEIFRFILRTSAPPPPSKGATRLLRVLK